MGSIDKDRVLKAMDGFTIELPNWGFADTGTRFGKFPQRAVPTGIEEKFHDAGLVHKLVEAQASTDLVAAERQIKQAFEADMTDVLVEWRKQRGLPADPLAELRSSAVINKLTKQRQVAREARGDVVRTSAYA